jgi:hypothetical protein
MMLINYINIIFRNINISSVCIDSLIHFMKKNMQNIIHCIYIINSVFNKICLLYTNRFYIAHTIINH